MEFSDNINQSMLSGTIDNDLPGVSERSTKVELMKAYKAMLNKYEENVKGKRLQQAKTDVNTQLVEKAGQYTIGVILQQFEGTKLDMSHAFDAFAQKITAEAKKFEELQQAIQIQQNRLKEIYDIEAAAISLEDLIKAQEIKKESFEAEYEELKITRKREQEEYQYTLNQQHKKDEVLRQEQEGVLKKREEEFMKREQEFQEFRKKVELFPKELLQAVEQAKKETAELIQKEMEMRSALVAKETAGEKKVFETRINFMEDLISKQSSEIVSIKKELEQSARQVQSIAEKAIEGSSGKQTLKAVSDIAMQQARMHE